MLPNSLSGCINVEVIPEQWTNSLTAGSKKFREVRDGTGRSSHNLIYTCIVRMVLKLWYIMWEGVQRKWIGKPSEKILRNTILKEELWTLDYITQPTPRTTFISYTLNFSSKPPMIVTFFLKSGQFFLPRSTNSLFGLVGPEPNPVLGSKPKLVLTLLINKNYVEFFSFFRNFINRKSLTKFFILVDMVDW